MFWNGGITGSETVCQESDHSWQKKPKVLRFPSDIKKKKIPFEDTSKYGDVSGEFINSSAGEEDYFRSLRRHAKFISLLEEKLKDKKLMKEVEPHINRHQWQLKDWMIRNLISTLKKNNKEYKKVQGYHELMKEFHKKQDYSEASVAKHKERTEVFQRENKINVEEMLDQNSQRLDQSIEDLIYPLKMENDLCIYLFAKLFPKEKKRIKDYEKFMRFTLRQQEIFIVIHKRSEHIKLHYHYTGKIVDKQNRPIPGVLIIIPKTKTTTKNRTKTIITKNRIKTKFKDEKETQTKPKKTTLPPAPLAPRVPSGMRVEARMPETISQKILSPNTIITHNQPDGTFDFIVEQLPSKSEFNSKNMPTITFLKKDLFTGKQYRRCLDVAGKKVGKQETIKRQSFTNEDISNMRVLAIPRDDEFFLCIYPAYTTESVVLFEHHHITIVMEEDK